MLTLYPYPNCLPPILGYLKKKSYPIRCIHYSRIPILFPQPKRKDAPVLRHFLLIALCLMLTAPTTLAQETNNQDRALKQKATAIPGRFQVYKPRKPQQKAMSQEEIEAIEALGYLPGTQEAKENTGILHYNQDAAYNGLNFYVSGHGPVAILTDMQGKLLHQWGADLFKAIPTYAKSGKKLPNHWRRAHLAHNGDVIGIYGGYGMVKVDKDSNILWSYNEHVHHDLEVLEDGTIYTLTREGMKIPELNPKGSVVMDSIVILDTNGTVLEKINVFDCFRNSPYTPMIRNMKKRGDVLHTNTIEVFNGAQAHHSPLYKKGNILLSMRDFDLICIIDPQTWKVVWALKGMWARQHQPVLIDNGNMLIFDNLGLGGERSRILEFNPLDQQVHWEYGTKKNEAFFSRLLGSVQRLPNGNTLISESDNGRIIEVTSDKKIAWEFISPHRAGEQQEFIASIYELVRLAPDFPHPWADPTTANLKIDITNTAR